MHFHQHLVQSKHHQLPLSTERTVSEAIDTLEKEVRHTKQLKVIEMELSKKRN